MGTMRKLTTDGMKYGVSNFLETPIILEVSSCPPCGLPLPPIWSFKFYGGIFDKWDNDIRTGRCLPQCRNDGIESLRRFKHSTKFEFGLSVAIETNAEREQNGRVPVV